MELDINIKENIKEVNSEYIEVKEALISIVTCSIVAHSIREAYVKVCDIKDKPIYISKSELMNDIKRDFRFVKGGQYKRSIQLNNDELLLDSQYRRDEYLNSYFRDYKGEVIENIKQIKKPELSSSSISSSPSLYDKIKFLDLSGQLQMNSDQLLSELIVNLAGCPVEVLILSNNKITDEGLKIIAPKIRSMNYLHTLFLNHNKFGDNGIEALFHNDNYSTSLRILNISYNQLGKTSAWFIGKLFSPGKISNLEELSIGGQVNYHHSIDNFFISLIPHFLFPGSRKLKKLDIAASGLTSNGISALVTLIAWTSSIESLNMSRIAVEASKYRYSFILALIMNQSLQYINIYQCGFRLSEMNSLKLYIETRQQNKNAFNIYLPSSYQRIDWVDQLNFIQHIITQRTVLEQKRIEEEEEIIKEKYTPPPVLRPTLMTKSQQSLVGCGISSVKKNSMYLSLEEIMKLNPMSIVSRARRSIAIIERNPIINERYKYPNSIINNLKNDILFKINLIKNEEIKKEENYIKIQKTKSQKLISKEITIMTSKAKNNKKINKSNYKKIENNSNLDYELYKKQRELIKYYIELQQLKDKVTIQTIFTNLEEIYVKYFYFNEIKKEILIINTPHQYSHFINVKNILFEITLTNLLLLKEIILNEVNLKNNFTKLKVIKKNIKCDILKDKIFSNNQQVNDNNKIKSEIIREINENQNQNENNNSNFNEEEYNDDEEDVEDIENLIDIYGRSIEKRGIGRENEYIKLNKFTTKLINMKNKVFKKFKNNQHYENILITKNPQLFFSLNYFAKFSQYINYSSKLNCAYDYYLFYYHTYVIYFKRYINLSNDITNELKYCLNILHSLHENRLIHDEDCYEKMLLIEMSFHELISLQNELNILIQILTSIYLFIEILYNDNIYNSTFQYSNLIPITQKYSPSCPISYSAIIRDSYPEYSLITVYLGFYYLNEEIKQRIKASSIEESNSKVSNGNNNNNIVNGNINVGKDKIDDLHSLISYKSLQSYDDMSLSTRQTNETTKAAKHSNKRAFQPRKGKRMNYPTKEELAAKMNQKMEEDDEDEDDEIEIDKPEDLNNNQSNSIDIENDSSNNNDNKQEYQIKNNIENEEIKIGSEKKKNIYNQKTKRNENIIEEEKEGEVEKEEEEEEKKLDEEKSKHNSMKEISINKSNSNSNSNSNSSKITKKEQRNSNENVQLLPQLPSIEKNYLSKSSSTLSSVYNRNNSQEKSESLKSLGDENSIYEIDTQNNKLILPKLHSSRSNASNDLERDDMSALTDGNSYRTQLDSNREESINYNNSQKKSSKKKKNLP